VIPFGYGTRFAATSHVSNRHTTALRTRLVTDLQRKLCALALVLMGACVNTEPQDARGGYYGGQAGLGCEEAHPQLTDEQEAFNRRIAGQAIAAVQEAIFANVADAMTAEPTLDCAERLRFMPPALPSFPLKDNDTVFDGQAAVLVVCKDNDVFGSLQIAPRNVYLSALGDVNVFVLDVSELIAYKQPREYLGVEFTYLEGANYEVPQADGVDRNVVALEDVPPYGRRSGGWSAVLRPFKDYTEPDSFRACPARYLKPTILQGFAYGYNATESVISGECAEISGLAKPSLFYSED